MLEYNIIGQINSFLLNAINLVTAPRLMAIRHRNIPRVGGFHTCSIALRYNRFIVRMFALSLG